MAHKVIFSLPDRELGKSDIEFKVKKNGQMYGRLLISKGAIVWRPRNKQRGLRIGWSRFDEFMQKNGRRVR